MSVQVANSPGLVEVEAVDVFAELAARHGDMLDRIAEALGPEVARRWAKSDPHDEVDLAAEVQDAIAGSAYIRITAWELDALHAAWELLTAHQDALSRQRGNRPTVQSERYQFYRELIDSLINFAADIVGTAPNAGELYGQRAAIAERTLGIALGGYAPACWTSGQRAWRAGARR